MFSLHLKRSPLSDHFRSTFNFELRSLGKKMKGNGDITVRNRWMRISGGPLSTSWKAYGVIEGARRMHMRAVIRTAWLRVVRLVDTGAFILPLCWLQSGRVCIGHIWPITHLSRMPEGATCAPNPFIQFRSRKFSPVRERISSSILLRRMRFPAGIQAKQSWPSSVEIECIERKGIATNITRNRECYLIDLGKLVVISLRVEL